MPIAETLDRLDQLSDARSFPTVDELNDGLTRIAEDHPGVCHLRRVGTSRRGDPLRMLSVGHGAQQALVVGCPHPNEPVGMLTVLALARLVAETPALRNETGYTWNFIGCIDPDGTRLNEPWFAGPFDIRHYHEGFYRPALDEQPEWTFPVMDERAYFDRTLPETEALARVIDELRPRFLYSLHNADFGGAFFVLDRDVPGLPGDLRTTAQRQGVPLSLAPVDVLDWPQLGPSVYRMPAAETLIQAHSSGHETRHGGGSAHYAARHGATSLIAEVPLWQDARAADETATPDRYADVLRSRSEQLRRDAATLRQTEGEIEPHLAVPAPFRTAAADFLRTAESLATGYGRLAEVSGDKPATVADTYGADSAVHMLRLRTSGVLRRQLTLERAAGNWPPALRTAYHRLDGLFSAWCDTAERELGGTFALNRIVAVQAAAALSTVAQLGDAAR